MTEARFLKRLEDLLRLGLDSSTTEHERTQALEEALRMVRAQRSTSEEENPHLWFQMTIMRRETCTICNVTISPAQKVYHCGEKFAHKGCFEDKYKGERT